MAKPRETAGKKVKNSLIFLCWTSEIKKIMTAIHIAVPRAEIKRDIGPFLFVWIINLAIQRAKISIRNNFLFSINLNKKPAGKTMAKAAKAYIATWYRLTAGLSRKKFTRREKKELIV
ncbi:MAG TPA: hypothetical protein GXZ93_06775 [Actinobacteria bacterium]|nr:hypothetical protein [Actinomycetota bacterium]